jgi:serine/threonine-protein phosphatase 2B catalytic subunit
MTPETKFNDSRQCSIYFGKELTKRFLEINSSVKTIIRAHEVFPEGYKKYNWGSKTPTVVTIFSAPNYCGVYGNKGAIIKLDVGVRVCRAATSR